MVPAESNTAKNDHTGLKQVQQGIERLPIIIRFEKVNEKVTDLESLLGYLEAIAFSEIPYGERKTGT